MKVFALETMDGMEEYDSEMFGPDVSLNNTTYRLIQPPFVSENPNDYYDIKEGQERYYDAYAVSEYGELARIVWKACDDWKDIQNERDMCDWEHPVKAEAI